MPVAFNGIFGSNQSKTAGTSLAVNPADISPVATDDIFVAFASDDVGSAFGITDGGTATITWTQEGSTATNGGQVKVQLWRGAVSVGGTLTDLTISWTTNITAKAAVAGWYSGVGTRKTLFYSGFAQGDTSSVIVPSNNGAGTSWIANDLIVQAFGVEGPNGDTITSAEFVGTGAGSIATPTIVGQNGTTGSGAASNITCALVHALADATSGNADGLQTTDTTSGSRGVAGTASVYDPIAAAAVPRHPAINHQNPGVLAKAWERGKSGVWLPPKLWTPRRPALVL